MSIATVSFQRCRGLLVLLLAGIVTQTSAHLCAVYHAYAPQLDFCADTLLWSHYKITQDTFTNITALDTAASEEYQTIYDGIYNNFTLLNRYGIKQKELYDCIAFASRVACHSNIRRCHDGSERKICRGRVCERFHRRCTVNGVDLVDEVFGSTYDCSTASTGVCSGADSTKSGKLVPVFLTGASMVLAMVLSFWQTG